MPLNNVRQLMQAETDGFTWMHTFRKNPTQVTGAGIWFDLSMSPGNPYPNFYVGAETVFEPLAQSLKGGIAHCINPESKKEYLRKLCLFTPNSQAAPLSVWLLDYLGFYPFIDESITDPQALTTLAPLPRYPSGEGVKMMAVVVAGQTGGQSFNVTYTNSQGVPNRVTQIHRMNSQPINGTVITSAGALDNSRAPFMCLQEGDTGVRSVQSIQFFGGDIGLIALVLVKPIADHSIIDFQAPFEVDYFQNGSQLPEIKPDAYLNLLCMPNNNLSGVAIHGYLETVIG